MQLRLAGLAPEATAPNGEDPAAVLKQYLYVATRAGWRDRNTPEPRDTYLVGALLATMFFVATPANATRFAAQIHITRPELHGRVVSAAMLAAPIAAPIGPPRAGLLLDHTGQKPAFFVFAALTAAVTIVMHHDRSSAAP